MLPDEVKLFLIFARALLTCRLLFKSCKKTSFFSILIRCNTMGRVKEPCLKSLLCGAQKRSKTSEAICKAVPRNLPKSAHFCSVVGETEAILAARRQKR